MWIEFDFTNILCRKYTRMKNRFWTDFVSELHDFRIARLEQ
jgi:hypothetical protein